MESLFTPLLERLAAALGAAGVSYMVIGGQAVIQHGQSRLTEDIDITLGIEVSDWRRADALLRAADFVPRVLDYEDVAIKGGLLLLADRSTSIRLDAALSGSEFEQAALKRAQVLRVGKMNVRFVAPDDLVIQKLVAGRERDHDDVRRLLRKQPALDRAYVERWLREYGIVLDQDLVAEFRRLSS